MHDSSNSEFPQMKIDVGWVKGASTPSRLAAVVVDVHFDIVRSSYRSDALNCEPAPLPSKSISIGAEKNSRRSETIWT